LRERWYDDLILDQVKVWGAMTANPVTIEAEASIIVAAQMMRDHKIGGLPVVETANSLQLVIGIITETDLLNYLIELLSSQVE